MKFFLKKKRNQESIWNYESRIKKNTEAKQNIQAVKTDIKLS